ncbi:hypothetical protein CARUB_v10007386mg [Capsella rubella]|uniref:Uncharacterized protein n=1 Tax=Capsella rubella TaxID=81985 RepID=R0FAM4_9BRAS|nr:uncharacterized protein LOC17878605 [Capsella rubella]EOA18781.1 hypothetical protein CARUB_v10007386mg [Capsella rubella]
MRTSMAFTSSFIILLLLLSQPLLISSENQESIPQVLTSWGRRLAQHADSIRVFNRKVRVGGGGRRTHRRVPSGGHGVGGSSSDTSRPSLSIALRFGSTVLSSILLILFAS